MCVIICCDQKSGHIKKKMIKQAEQMNSDGMGIAWINKDGLVEWRKGLTSKGIIKVIAKEKPSLKKGYIVHARIASIGSVTPELTHPFEISPDANQNLKGTTSKGVVFHNGTWTEYEDIMIKTFVRTGGRMYKGENSDSRSMAYLANQYGIEFLNLIQDQKIAVLTPKGIKTFGSFPKVDKHHCSNTWFKNGGTQIIYGGYDYDGFNDEDLSSPYNPKAYCWKCDRNLSESKFKLDFELCDDCFNQKNERDLDEVIDQNIIRAKDYAKQSEKDYHNMVRKFHNQGAIP